MSQNAEEPIRIESFVIIAKLTNGKCHQVLISEDQRQIINHVIMNVGDGKAKVDFKEIEGIQIEKRS